MAIMKHWFYFTPMIVFSILFFAAMKKSFFYYKLNNKIYKKRNMLPIIIIVLYFVSSIAVVLINTEKLFPFFNPELYTYYNFLLFSFILFLYLIPSFYIKPLSPEDRLPHFKNVSIIMYLMIILGLYAVFYQLPYAIKSMNSNANFVRIALNRGEYNALPDSLATTLAVGISYFNLFYLVFYFLSIIQKRNIIVRTGLLIASLSYVVSSMTFAARDGLVFYIVNFIFTYFFFRERLSPQNRRELKTVFFFFLSVVLIILSIITYQRFAQYKGFLNGIIGYIGQQPYVFSVTLNTQHNFYHGNLRFPFFKSIFSNYSPVIRRSNYEWMFGTFIKDFYSVNGFQFLITISVFLILFFYIKIKKSNHDTFYRRIIIVFFYYQFMVQGLFYFRLGQRAGNIYIIILFFIYLFSYTLNRRI